MKINTDRIWIITDLHFGVRSNSLEWLEIQKDYFENWFMPILKKKKKDNDILFVLGDIFDNRQSINTLVQNTVIDIFENLGKILPVYIILGNHDTFRKSTNDINSLKILNYLENVQVFEEPEFLEFDTTTGLLMPWRKNAYTEKECLEKHGDCNYIFSHTGISGFYFNRYIKMDDEFLDNNVLSNFDRVITGHIHYAQLRGNVIMPGCPYELTRSDSDNEKGIYIFKPKENDFEFIENNYTPKFLKIQLEDILDTPFGEFQKMIQNNYVDIIVNLKWSVDFPFNLLLDSLSGYRKVNVIVNPNDEDIQLDEDENAD